MSATAWKDQLDIFLMNGCLFPACMIMTYLEEPLKRVLDLSSKHLRSEVEIFLGGGEQPPDVGDGDEDEEDVEVEDLGFFLGLYL